MRILRNFLLLLLVLAVIAGVVIATCPAEYAYRLVADRLGVLKLGGITGSIWQGHANSTQVLGQELGPLDWQLEAAPLLSREVMAHIRFGNSDVNASGIVDRTADGLISIRGATFRFPANMAAPALDIPALQLLGSVDGTLSEAHLRGFWVSEAAGTLHWNGAAVAGAAQAQFGDLEATFSSAPDGSISGVAHDLGGPLQLNGTFKVSAGNFEADANLAARDGNPQVIEALHYIGEPAADGTSHLIIRGQLFKLF
jgi:general secretion pathway protein N